MSTRMLPRRLPDTRELVRLSSKTGRQWIVTGDFNSSQKEGETALCLANGPETHWDDYFDDFALLHTRQREEEVVWTMQSPDKM